MTTEMELVVGCDGGVRCIYGEELALREIGKLQITRASHVEPDAEGYWWADMGPSGGPVLGPYGSRTEALEAESKYLVTCLHRNFLAVPRGVRPKAIRKQIKQEMRLLSGTAMHLPHRQL